MIRTVLFSTTCTLLLTTSTTYAMKRSGGIKVGRCREKEYRTQDADRLGGDSAFRIVSRTSADARTVR